MVPVLYKLTLSLIIITMSIMALSQTAHAQNNTSSSTSQSLSTQSNNTNTLPISSLPGLPAVTVTTNSNGSQDYSVSLQILAMMTALSFIPALLLMMTSFTRIIIVFAILRQALGLQQSPSNQILIGLTLFLTLFIMAPVFDEVKTQALQPYMEQRISSDEALVQAQKPFHAFMLSQTRESDLKLFMDIADRGLVDTPEEVPLSILIPSFITSELKTAFQIGFILFIPFLVIDLVVASVLMAMGMMMLSPLIISLPFKIMLFVLVDGWAMLMGTLAASFGVLQ